MTRACPYSSEAASHKVVKFSSSCPRSTVSGGVVKSRRPHSPGRSFKTYTKADSTAQCLLILKSLLPNASTQQQSSELELVKETIAYITYLESVLQRAPPADKPANILRDSATKWAKFSQ